MAEDQGCLGCGCAGCLPLIGGVFIWSVVGAVLVSTVTIVAALAAIAGVGLLIAAGVSYANDMQRAKLNCSQHPTTTTTTGDVMGKTATVNPITTQIKSWTSDDLAHLPSDQRALVHEIQRKLASPAEIDEFLAFTRAFPIGAIFAARDGADVRVKISAVDHYWSGIDGEPVDVVITFKSLESDHELHWPAKDFHENWEMI